MKTIQVRLLFHQLLVYEAPGYLNNTKQQKICLDLTQKLTFAFLNQNYRSKLERRQEDWIPMA